MPMTEAFRGASEVRLDFEHDDHISGKCSCTLNEWER